MLLKLGVRILLVGFLFLLVPASAYAHCPLCTAGVGILAVGAAWFGVDPLSIGIFVGAFGLVTGLWIARLIGLGKSRRLQLAVASASFLLTIIPLAPLFDVYTPFSIFFIGDYGSWLNRTYLLNRFVLGGFVGAGLIVVAPTVSRALTRLRGKQIPYQGMALTFLSLVMAAVVIELFV